jgi:hypothetical protein
MVSAVERPCLVLLAAYGRVRGSQARRRHAAQAREASLAAQPLGVVAGGDRQRAGHVGADPKQRGQLRCRLGDQPVQLAIEPADLSVKQLPAASKLPHGQLGRCHRRVKRPRRKPAARVTNTAMARPRS